MRPGKTSSRTKTRSGAAKGGIGRRRRPTLTRRALAALFDAAPIGVIAIDARGRITYLNPRQCEQSNFRREDLLGQDYRATFVETLGRAGLLPHFDRLKDENVPYEVTMPRYRRHADGAVISFSARGWRSGDSILILNSVDRELARQLGRYEQLFENANDGIFVLDREGRFLAVNQSFADMTGTPREDILGRTTELFLPGRFEQSKARLERILTEGRLGPYELDIRTPIGKRTISLNGFALLEDGVPTGVMNIARDVTDAVRMNAELREARDQALLASRLKTAFLANMSHEIRTPLNVILGFSELIEDKLAEVADGETREAFEIIRRNGKRLLQTIGGILDISRIEASAFDLHPKILDLRDVIRKALSDFRPFAEAKGLQLTSNVAAEHTLVRFDEYCLAQTIENLLGNAVKFTSGGAISVTLANGAHDHLELTIRDTGIGIDDAFLPRVFEPFSQEESGASRTFEGSGLGLPLAKRYVEMNAAELIVESRKGEGTAVTIRFPSAIRVAAALDADA